jgi:hypothetical protein
MGKQNKTTTHGLQSKRAASAVLNAELGQARVRVGRGAYRVCGASVAARTTEHPLTLSKEREPSSLPGVPCGKSGLPAACSGSPGWLCG